MNLGRKENQTAAIERLKEKTNMTAVQCSPLTNPIKGFVTGPNSYGDVVNFTCEPGYKLVGTSSLTCLSDGTWDGKSPTCTAVECPLLSPHLNGKVTGTNSYGDVVNFTCEPGYKLVGTSSLTCLADGTWNGNPATCTAVKCHPLSNPFNGFVTGSNSYGDVVHFTCNPGYKLVGTSSLTCLADGAWNGNPATCTAVKCHPLSNPFNGFVSGSNSYRDVANFTCKPGYKLVGTSSLTCLSDGTWDGTSPTCTAVQCPLVSPPTNGILTGTNSYGDVVNFTFPLPNPFWKHA
ncbi:PREDICTED: E-selectin-like [Branchiostoma belcheri]|uniref:E-selectin-like n=1 Tax=Branchiostoma belcheri TaxID=7741 RepID=A0A6P4Z008_BRABE|nr:PREDICTED: E-selectin-like [Branchiostoma belcheri]